MRLNQKGLGNIVIIVIVLTVALAAVGGFIFISSDDEEVTSDTSSGQAADNSDFSTPEPPYVITATVTDSTEQVSVGTIKFESENKWELTTDTDQGTVTMVYADGYTYTQNGDQGWIRFPAGDQAGNDTNIDAFRVPDEQLNEYRDNFNEIGKESCGDSECTVYQVTDEGQDGEVKVYVDSDRRVVKYSSSEGEETTVISYDFDTEVSITVPTDYQEFDIPS